MIDARFRPIDKWPGTRTPSYRRKRAQFRASYAKTLDLLEYELRHLRARDIVIQAGFTFDQIRNDGWPRSNAQPSDPGVIVSFQSPQGEFSFPCDRYTDWQGNLRAIALSLQALRAVDRYGVTQHAEQYRGWQQLPPPAPPSSNTMSRDIAATVLANYSIFTPAEILTQPDKREEAYRQAARKTHPDAGGSHEKFVLVQQAKRALEAS